MDKFTKHLFCCHQWHNDWIWVFFISYFSIGVTILRDIEPDSYTGRALTIIYLPVSCRAAADIVPESIENRSISFEILILLTAYLLARLYAQTVEAFLGDLQFQNLQDTMGDMLHSSMNKDQFISQLMLLDIDDDGELTRNEFIVQMLINEYQFQSFFRMCLSFS